MSSNRFTLINHKYIALLFAAVLLFSACGKKEDGAAAAADLVQTASLAPTNFRTAECVIGNVSRDYSSQASIYYEVYPVLFRGTDSGILKELNAYNRQMVTKGDVLAVIELDVAHYSDELEKLKMNVANAEKYLELEKTAREDTIAEMSARLPFIAANEAEILKIRIEKTKLEYEYYVYDAELTINNWKKEMAEIEKKLEGVTITAPTDGLIMNITTLGLGSNINPETNVMNIVYTGEMRFTFNADSANVRYNTDVTISVAGDLFFRGRIVSDPTVANQDGGNMDFRVLLLDPPEDILSFYNLISNRRLSVTGKSTELVGVPVLPYNSIYNENGKRYVQLLENNIVKKRYIQIGLFNYQEASVVSGIKPGERILE